MLESKAEPVCSQLSAWCGTEPSPRCLCSTGRALLCPSSAGRVTQAAEGASLRCLWDRTPISTQIHPQSWQRPLGIPASGTGVSPVPCWKHRDTDPRGRCSQGNAWLTPAPLPSSVGAVGAVRGSAPLPCVVGEGAGGVIHSPDLFGVLQFLWRADCCRRAQVAAVITCSVCPSLHRSPQQWRCLRCPRGPSRTLLMGLPGPIMLAT